MLSSGRTKFRSANLTCRSCCRRSLATQVAHPVTSRQPQTFIEKVVQRHAVDLSPGKVVKAGDFVSIRPRHVMTHDNTGPVISKFKSIGAKSIFNTSQPVFTLDHDVQNKSSKNLTKYATIEAFAREIGVDFYPAGRGIGHQIMIEEGYAFPGTLAVASDSHSNMYGGVGCVGTPIVRTDAAALWATGQTWWQVPEIVKVELRGKLPTGVTGKDIIVALCGTFNKDEVLNCGIEFVGEGVKELSVDERLAIANMTTEWGALAGVFPIDNTLLSWYNSLLKKRDLQSFLRPSASLPSPSSSHPRLNESNISSISSSAPTADPDAFYSKTLTLDLSTLVPHVSGPNSVKVSTALPQLEAENIPIHKAYLVSCTNSRASDLKAAAEVMKGKKVAEGVEFYVAAASSVVQAESEASGDWGTLVGAGAKVLPAGCGPCIGLGTGLLEDGETGISATNRNYKGRMGSPKAFAYLASPAVVAASAVAGKICGPEGLKKVGSPSSQAPKISISYNSPRASSSASASSPSEDAPAPSGTVDLPREEILPGFPSVYTGTLLFAPQDNLNTDAIYPGKYTYQDDITALQQSEVVMENYDTSFASLVSSLRGTPEAIPKDLAFTSTSGQGIIFAAGLNFGTGSSREQAATAIRNAGIPLVFAASFSDVFKRNAINNALICVECPEMIEELTRRFGKDGKRNGGTGKGELTERTRWEVTFDSATGLVEVVGEGGERLRWQSRSIGRSVQEIAVARGLEGWVRQRLV